MTGLDGLVCIVDSLKLNEMNGTLNAALSFHSKLPEA